MEITKLIATFTEVKTILGIGDTSQDTFLKAHLPYAQDVLLNQVLGNNFNSFIETVGSSNLSVAYTAGDATISLSDSSEVLTGDYLEFGNLVFVVTDADTLAVTLSSGTDADQDNGEGVIIYRLNEPIFPSDLKTTIARMLAYDIYKNDNSLNLSNLDGVSTVSIGRVSYTFKNDSIDEFGYPKASYKGAEMRYKKYPLDEPVTTNNVTGVNS